MSIHSSLTERQRFWLEHLRACGSGSLKAYAEQHALEVSALYEAKSRLKRKGMLDAPPARFVRVQRDTPELSPELSPELWRIHLRNGTCVEVACAPEHWARLLDSVAGLP